MKLVLIALALFSVATLMVFCKHTRYTPDNLPAQQIRFGKGGGFTGIEQAYTLLDNGQLFDANRTELDSAKRRVAKACFKTVEQLKLAQLDFKHPGNTYSFIEVPSGDGGYRRISWGAADAPVDKNIAELFEKLMSLVRKG